MFIHTNLLTEDDVQRIVTSHVKGIIPLTKEHGSRSHQRKIRLDLADNGALTVKGRRVGAASTLAGSKGATFDEWGIVINAIFEADRDAVVGPYPSYGDFLYMTDWRYQDLEWDDQHGRHRWEFLAPREFGCECGAVKRDRVGNGFVAV